MFDRSFIYRPKFMPVDIYAQQKVQQLIIYFSSVFKTSLCRYHCSNGRPSCWELELVSRLDYDRYFYCISTHACIWNEVLGASRRCTKIVVMEKTEKEKTQSSHNEQIQTSKGNKYSISFFNSKYNSRYIYWSRIPKTYMLAMQSTSNTIR